MTLTQHTPASVAGLVTAAVEQAIEYWNTPQDEEDAILARLAEQGVTVDPAAFAEIVEAKIAADWARNGNDLAGYGYDLHVDHETRQLFIERQEDLAELGIENIAHSQPETFGMFARECGVGLVAILAVASWALVFVLAGV